MARFINETLTSNTSTNWIDWPGGPGTFIAAGTWEGRTAKLQMRIEGSSAVDVSTDLTFTADKAAAFQICPCELRVNMSGNPGGGSPSVKFRVAPSSPGWFPQNDLPDTGSATKPTFSSNHYINEILDETTTVSTVINWRGGPGSFFVQGDWDQDEEEEDVTARLLFNFEGSNWVPVPGMELTFNQDDMGGFQLGPCKLKVELTVPSGREPSVRVRVVPAYAGWLMDPPIPDTTED